MCPQGSAMPMLTLLVTVRSQIPQPQESRTLQRHICPSQRVQGRHFQCPKEIRQSSTLCPYLSTAVYNRSKHVKQQF